MEKGEDYKLSRELFLQGALKFCEDLPPDDRKRLFASGDVYQ
jgi:hypothetical protein